MTPRETYYGALMTQLQPLLTNGTVNLLDRLVSLEDAVAPATMPAIYMDTDKEEVTRGAGQQALVTITVRLFVYVPAPDPNTPAGAVLSQLLDAIDGVLAPPFGVTTQTLGGVVGHCWVEGTIERFEAGIDNLALAIMPVHMMVMR